MWNKETVLLNTLGLVLPAAGAASTARQVASLFSCQSDKNDPPQYFTVQKKGRRGSKM